MTCIVGIEHDGGVLIAGDSAGLSGWSKMIRADLKVFTIGNYVMGFTDSFRMGQLLRYGLAMPGPTHLERNDLHHFMCTTFIDGVRKTLKDGGWAKTDSERELGGSFLVGVAGQLFMVASDYQVARTICGYNAVGCGDDLALGSLHTTAQYDIEPQTRAQLALEAAADHSGGVAGPFVYTNLEV